MENIQEPSRKNNKETCGITDTKLDKLLIELFNAGKHINARKRPKDYARWVARLLDDFDGTTTAVLQGNVWVTENEVRLSDKGIFRLIELGEYKVSKAQKAMLVSIDGRRGRVLMSNKRDGATITALYRRRLLDFTVYANEVKLTKWGRKYLEKVQSEYVNEKP